MKSDSSGSSILLRQIYILLSASCHYLTNMVGDIVQQDKINERLGIASKSNIDKISEIIANRL